MSQIIACKTETGIVMAADGRAVDFEPGGNMVRLEMTRLVQLTPHAAILAGGAAAGEAMCRGLANFLANEKLTDIEDAYSAALPFLATEYERFMRRACAFLPVDPIHHVHFILGGHSARNAANPFQLHLIWTKKRLPQLDSDEIDSAYSVPRLIGLEVRLAKLARERKAPADILPEIRTSLEKQAAVNEEIAGPFAFGQITREGFERLGA
jgi:hypothetical protein